jgi:hypothetical protein
MLKGLFVRLDLQAAESLKAPLRSNPLVDGVILYCRWRTLEPQRGNYSTAALVQEIALWKAAGKQVILNIMPYGQTADKVNSTVQGAHYCMETPPWLYKQPDVSFVQFTAGNGGVPGAGGELLSLPQVWHEGFLNNYLTPLAAAVANAVNGTVDAVNVGFGHIGHTTIQGSPAAVNAYTSAGLTVSIWQAYCQSLIAIYGRYFTEPLTLISDKILMSGTKQQTAFLYALSTTWTGVGVIHLEIGPTEADMQPIYDDCYSLPFGITGLGDDWPLYVPPDRQNKEPTVGHNEAYLEAALNNALALKPKFIVLQPPEFTSDNAEVTNILSAARNKLL